MDNSTDLVEEFPNTLMLGSSFKQQLVLYFVCLSPSTSNYFISSRNVFENISMKSSDCFAFPHVKM